MKLPPEIELELLPIPPEVEVVPAPLVDREVAWPVGSETGKANMMMQDLGAC